MTTCLHMKTTQHLFQRITSYGVGGGHSNRQAGHWYNHTKKRKEKEISTCLKDFSLFSDLVIHPLNHQRQNVMSQVRWKDWFLLSILSQRLNNNERFNTDILTLRFANTG